MKTFRRDTAGTQRDTTGTQRGTTGTQRDTTGTQRDITGTQRDTTGTQKDITGTQRGGFKIFKQLQLQERDKLKIDLITKTEWKEYYGISRQDKNRSVKQST